MPLYTYQIALKEDDEWFRAYVCAEDKYKAVFQLIEENPPLTLEFLLQSDELEVERCD